MAERIAGPSKAEAAGGSGAIWRRGLFMLLFVIFYNIAEFLLVVVAVFQFLCKLIAGRTSDPVTRFGASLAEYFGQVVRFLTFNSERKPFPFGEWPEAKKAPSGT